MIANTSLNILTWKAHQTLVSTLNEYKNKGLLDLFKEKNIFVNEFSDLDYQISKYFEFDNIIFSKENKGIGSAISTLAKITNMDNILFLENDWLISESSNLEKTLSDSEEALNHGVFDFIKLRSTIEPGEPLYSKVYYGREMEKPEFLLDSTFSYGNRAKDLFPNELKEIKINDSTYIYTNSMFGNHSNNPFLCKKSFYLNEISQYSGLGTDLEGNIFDVWKNKNYKVAQSIPGIFKHYRIDR